MLGRPESSRDILPKQEKEMEDKNVIFYAIVLPALLEGLVQVPLGSFIAVDSRLNYIKAPEKEETLLSSFSSRCAKLKTT